MTKRRRQSRTRRLGEAGPTSETQRAAKEFWHGPGGLPATPSKIQITEDAAAVIRSLGKPPLNGQEEVAEHYFDAIYQRSVTLASALAAAAELVGDDGDDLTA